MISKMGSAAYNIINTCVRLIGIGLFLILLGVCNPVFWLAVIAYILATHL